MPACAVRRFVHKQLIVELTLNPTIASFLGWTIRQYSIIAFALYCGGAASLHPPWGGLSRTCEAVLCRKGT